MGHIFPVLLTVLLAGELSESDRQAANGPQTCPLGATGDCCVGHDSAGCDDFVCCEQVCASMPSCCEAVWTDACAAIAEIVCSCKVDPPTECPASDEDCCTIHTEGGCEDECCCQGVCEQMPSCCDELWGPACVTLAGQLCAGVCSSPDPACPSENDCFSANTSPGCSIDYCCNRVCGNDPFCCETRWDSKCSAQAETLCTCEKGPPGCPVDATGDCCFANETPGCTDSACCEKVCAGDPFCCESEWDDICVVDANRLCGCPACPDEVVEWIFPPDGWIDARQPHAVDDATTLSGVDEIIVTAPTLTQACWRICETVQNPELHGDVPPNSILEVASNKDGTATIFLAHPLTPGEVTYISYGGGLFESQCSYTVLPADVNGDGVSAANDILALIDALNMVTPQPVYQTDADRSGEPGGADILRVIDLLNGAGAFEPWLDAGVKVFPGCETGG